MNQKTLHQTEGTNADPTSASMDLKTSAQGMSSRTERSIVPWTEFSMDSLTKTQFDWATGLSCGLASKLSYSPEPDVSNTVKNTWGFPRCEFVEATHTQCFVGWTDQFVLLAFRGTESFGDWHENLDLVSSHQSYGDVHRGFFNAFAAVEPCLQSILSEVPGRPIVLTGHSLGGAIATIAAARWFGTKLIRAVYTFGQPAVGKNGFLEFMQANYPTNFYRFVNDEDIVPRVPPNYCHVGRLIRFDLRGNVRSRAFSPSKESLGTSTDLEMISDSLYKEIQAILRSPLFAQENRPLESTNSIELEGLFPSVSDHAIDEYLAKIDIKIGESMNGA